MLGMEVLFFADAVKQKSQFSFPSVPLIVPKLHSETIGYLLELKPPKQQPANDVDWAFSIARTYAVWEYLFDNYVANVSRQHTSQHSRGFYC